jgi:hypothetical protein
MRVRVFDAQRSNKTYLHSCCIDQNYNMCCTYHSQLNSMHTIILDKILMFKMSILHIIGSVLVLGLTKITNLSVSMTLRNQIHAAIIHKWYFSSTRFWINSFGNNEIVKGLYISLQIPRYDIFWMNPILIVYVVWYNICELPSLIGGKSWLYIKMMKEGEVGY